MSMSTKEKMGDALTRILGAMPLIIVLLIAIGYIALRIYCFANYGNMPAAEVPAWVWWVMYGGGNS